MQERNDEMPKKYNERELLTQKRFELYCAEFKASRDPSWAVKVMEMLVDTKEARLIPMDVLNTSWIVSDRGSVCCKCNIRYEKGARIFLRDSQGWHTECATEDEKGSCNAYKKFLKDKEPRTRKTIPNGKGTPANGKAVVIREIPPKIVGAYNPSDYGHSDTDTDKFEFDVE